MARAELFGLMNRLNSGCRNLRTHLFRLITHHHEHSFGRGDFQRGIDGMPYQRLAPGPVQHLRHPGFHACTLPRGQDNYCGIIQHFVLV
jgi:hypothetical protein